MTENQTIQERLAATWESHMHDGNGAFVTAVFFNVLRELKTKGQIQPFELQDRVISTAFEPFENEENGGLLWAVASNAVSAMAGEFSAWLKERKAARNA
jgi:hypothetical protein